MHCSGKNLNCLNFLEENRDVKKGGRIIHLRGGMTPYILLQTITRQTHILVCCLSEMKRRF